jgi:hypothetical protein
MLKQAAKQILGKARSDEISYRRRLAAYGDAYLKPLGWDRSILSYQAENADGPVPWITYPALRMLERVVQPHFKVFEYGAGNSSLWWASRVARVVSVEHDEKWASIVSERAPANLMVVAKPLNSPAEPRGLDMATAFLRAHPDRPLSGNFERDVAEGLVCDEFVGYAAEIAAYPPGYFDVIVIDGMARALTAWMAAHSVAADGFIVFDNADRWQYNTGFAALAEAGFMRLDFYGTRPILVDESCTSIFARSFEWARASMDIPRGRRSDLRW